MAEWFETYEDSEGLAASRLRTRRLVLVFAVVSGLVMTGAATFAFVQPAWAAASAGVAGLILVGHAGWLAWHLGRMRRVVWRVELSIHHIVGHDVTGQRRVLGWSDVRWVNLDDAGVGVAGRRMGRRVQFQIPTSFPDYSRVGNRILSYAEALDRPVYVNGRAWQSLGLDTLLPLLDQREPTR